MRSTCRGVDAPPRRLRPDPDLIADEFPLGGVYAIARWAEGDPDLMSAAPLDPDDVARRLAEHSFVNMTDERRALTPAEVAEGTQALGLDHAIVIDPMVIQHVLRGLEVRVFLTGTDRHAEAIHDLDALAHVLGGRLIAKDVLE